MEIEQMSEYVKFMCSILPKETRVGLYVSDEAIEKYDIPNDGIMQKMDVCPRTLTIVYPAELYTRSAKIRIDFDDLTENGGIYTEEFIYYLSRRKGPEELLHEFNKKVSQLVQKRFIDEGREEDIALITKRLKETRRDSIKSAFLDFNKRYKKNLENKNG